MPAGMRDGYSGLEGAKQSGMHTLRGMSAGVRTRGGAQMQVWPVHRQKAKKGLILRIWVERSLLRFMIVFAL